MKPRRDKLGLALAGGGFRASLFHVGVLRRMAELDLLRYVEALSTVSGGSIVGALYILCLKKHLDEAPGGKLTRDQYIEITREVEATLVGGIGKNLRTRLFMNPFGVLRVLLTEHSLGRRMARLYERYLFRDLAQQIQPQTRLRRWLMPGRVLMGELTIRPGGERLEAGIEAYNEEQVRTGGSALTHLIVNATSLNSGARFWFSHTEVGDWYLGHIRRSEIGLLLARKHILEAALEDLEARIQARPDADTIEIDEGKTLPAKTVCLAIWWRRRAEDGGRRAPRGWEDLFQVTGFPGKLPTVAFGALRQAKIPAWYVRIGARRAIPVTGGLETAENMVLFWESLARIDEELAARLRPRAEDDPRILAQLLDFVLELYWLRSAEVVSPGIRRDWDRLTLGDAVGASACFPPVFPPFLETGFYDDLHVSRLGLTDGGVFDNIGITALRDEHCNYIIASDTSGPLGLKQRSSAGRVELGGRIVSILMGAIAGLQREQLQESRRVSRAITKAVTEVSKIAGEICAEPLGELEGFLAPRDLDGLAFFHIHSPRLALPPGAAAGLEIDYDREALSRLRTDLDAFGDVEIDALINHGYDSADRYIRRYLADKELLAPSRAYWSTSAVAPRRVPRDMDRVNRALRVGQLRFFRSLVLGAPLSWAFTVAVLALLIRGTWRAETSLDAVAMRLAEESVQGLDGALWQFGAGWTGLQFPIGPVLVVAVATLVVVVAAGMRRGFQAREEPVPRLRRRAGTWRRRMATGLKWLGLYKGNLLWLVKGLPLVLAFAVSFVAWVSYVFYGLPYLRKTRQE